MKKILFILFLIFLTSGKGFAFEDIFVDERPPQIEQESQSAQPAPEIMFLWNDLTREERVSIVNKYKDIIFNDKSEIYLDKNEFKNKYKNLKKDKEYKHHYMLVNNGVTEDEDAKYNPFYYRKNTLIIYAIQYKTDIHNSLYYTAYGKLYYVDITSNDYPEFPYYSMQYDRHGNLKSAIYFVSDDIQYMYDSNKEFQGVWYKNQMFNLENKQISTREGW